MYWRILRKCLSLQQNFVAATSRTDSVWFDFLRLVAATKFLCGDKDFHKDSPVHTERFVAATCRLTVLLQLVARSVHMEWSVAATCCCNLSPSAYRPLGYVHTIPAGWPFVEPRKAIRYVRIVWTETAPATHVVHNLDPWALLRMTTREGRALGNPGTRLSLIGSRKKKTCFWLVHSNFHERGWTCGVSGDSKTTVALRQSDWIPQFSNKIHLATYRKHLNVKNKNTTTPLPAKIIGREGKLSLIVILLHHTYPFLASLASGTSGTSVALQVARRLRVESDDHATWRSRLQ